MSGVLQKFARGFAEAGTKLYYDQAFEETKAKLQSAREKRLAGFGEKAAQTRREHETKLQTKRLEATSAEKLLDRDARLASPTNRLAESKLDDKAQLRSLAEQFKGAETEEEKLKIRESIKVINGTIGDRYLSNPKGVFDMDTGEYLEPPTSKADLRKTAASVAKDIYNAKRGKKEPFADIFTRVMKTLGAASNDDDKNIVIEAGKSSFKGSGPGGAITEGDILKTMESTGQSRSSIMERLGG